MTGDQVRDKFLSSRIKVSNYSCPVVKIKFLLLEIIFLIKLWNDLLFVKIVNKIKSQQRLFFTLLTVRGEVTTRATVFCSSVENFFLLFSFLHRAIAIQGRRRPRSVLFGGDHPFRRYGDIRSVRDSPSGSPRRSGELLSSQSACCCLPAFVGFDSVRSAPRLMPAGLDN